MDKEDGEMSDDNAMLVDTDDPGHTAPVTKMTTEDCTLLYKAEKNGIIVKQLEKADAAKLEERAKRFGLNLTGNRVITQGQIDELYKNFGIENGNERHFRFDALYLNGVDGLTTKEIFEYLEDYKPLSLEWIDEVSCNVVCQDHISAALALLVHSREIQNIELKEMLAKKSNHHWREGMPHPKQDLILIRFATNGEKKKLKKPTDTKKYLDQYFDQTMDSASKNPWGDLCKSWGVYDHQEVFQYKLPKIDYENEIDDVEPRKPIQIRNKKLAMRLGKRRQNNDEQSDESVSDSEWKSKSKAPRMRMHADDEESKLKKKIFTSVKPVEQDEQEKYAPLSIEVVNTQSAIVKKEHTKLSDKFKFHGGNKQSSIQSRLGEKVVPSDENSTQSEASNDESSNEDSDHNLMSKVQKVSSTPSKTGSVWSRLETQQRQPSVQSDLRQILKCKTKQNKPQTNDLRDRLGKCKPANLRIEIDNKRYSDNDE